MAASAFLSHISLSAIHIWPRDRLKLALFYIFNTSVEDFFLHPLCRVCSYYLAIRILCKESLVSFAMQAAYIAVSLRIVLIFYLYSWWGPLRPYRTLFFVLDCLYISVIC